MATDEAMLDEAVQAGTPSLRFYQWQRPTLSLGYFQHHADRLSHPPSHPLQAIRRLTGGGAILHDWEMTYSMAIPAEHPVTRRHQDLVRIAHTSLIDALQRLGISAWRHKAQPNDRSNRPFLCFQRLCHGDLLMEHPLARESDPRPAAKVVGSAQRRRRGALLQHGSVLLGRSWAAPELPGIFELAGIRLPFSDLLATWSPLLAANLDLDLKPATRSDRTLGRARRQLQTRYTRASWNEKR